jgi:hypothetical protein
MAQVPITQRYDNKVRINVVTLGSNELPDDRPTWQAGQYRWFLKDSVHEWFVDMNIPYELATYPDPKMVGRDIFHVDVADRHEVIVRLRWMGSA